VRQADFTISPFYASDCIAKVSCMETTREIALFAVAAQALNGCEGRGGRLTNLAFSGRSWRGHRTALLRGMWIPALIGRRYRSR